jgi:nucleolar GTP-binding protein
LCLYLLFQGRKKLEEAFQHGKHAVDDLVNVAKVLTAVIFISSWRIRR